MYYMDGMYSRAHSHYKKWLKKKKRKKHNQLFQPQNFLQVVIGSHGFLVYASIKITDKQTIQNEVAFISIFDLPCASVYGKSSFEIVFASFRLCLRSFVLYGVWRASLLLFVVVFLSSEIIIFISSYVRQILHSTILYVEEFYFWYSNYVFVNLVSRRRF